MTEEQALFHLSEKSCIPQLHCMCVMCMWLSTSARWAWKHVAVFLCIGILVLLLLQPVFNMADACSVANNSPLTRDRVVESRFGQGSPQVELQSHLSILCTRRHKVEQSFCPKVGIFLWGAVFTAASIPSCMLTLYMYLEMLECVCVCVRMYVCCRLQV